MALPIPGLKVLDEILAGLPTNSQQRKEIDALKRQVADLISENIQLKANLAELSPKSDMAVETAKILQYFFREDRPLSAEKIASVFQMITGVAKYHVESLHKRDLLQYGPIAMNNEPLKFEITEAGRAYIVEHGLA
jgi:hypothetical protein